MTIPTGFQLGPIYIYFYGIILMTGALAGGWLASREAKRKGYDPEIVWDGLIWVLIFGIIGARLWHVFTPPQSMVDQGLTTGWYLLHPLDLLNTRQGGLGIPGAVIGGVLGLYLFARRRKLKFLEFADFGAPGLALGQAIGRWGNFVNQEVYGSPTDLPWAVHIAPQNRLPGYAEFETFHPLFLYESLWSIGNLAFLIWLSRKYAHRLLPGDVFFIYLIIYPVGRFLLEFLRLDASYVGGINANQALMAVVALVSAGILYWRHRGVSQEVPPAAPSAEGEE
jgi:phosphatidylglycerol:prolipoprotein diacylglycerol transferase